MSVGKGFFKRVPGASVRAKLLSLIGALVVIGAVIAGGLYYAFPVQISIMGALSRNYLITFFAPGGTATTESNANYKSAGSVASAPSGEATAATSGDWPSYNRTLDLRPVFAAQPDQCEKRRKAQSSMHLRHGSVHRFRVRSDRGRQRPDRHNRIRHFLHQSGHMRRKLANSRGLSAEPHTSQPRCRLSRRDAVSGQRRRKSAAPMTSRPVS